MILRRVIKGTGSVRLVSLTETELRVINAKVGDYVYWHVDAGKLQLRKATIS